jgi:hypothetical protein
MPKMKVGEFFKLYNIALGLKFKNSKFIFFYMWIFEQKSDLNCFCPKNVIL